MFGCDYENHFVASIVVFLLSAAVGLILAANFTDHGPMHDKEPLILATPFIAAPVCFLSVLCHFAFRIGWQKRSDWQQRRKEHALFSRIQQIPDLVLDSAEALKLHNYASGDRRNLLVRSGINRERAAFSANMMNTTNGFGTDTFIVTIHPDGSSTKGTMAGVKSFTDDSLHTAIADPHRHLHPYQTTHPVQLKRFVGSAIFGGWKSEYALYTGMFGIGPMALASVCPFLLASGCSHTVSFIPAVLATVIAAVAACVAICNDFFWDLELPRHYMVKPCFECLESTIGTIFSVTFPLGCLMAFFVLYPLALDGYIATASTGDWVLILTPIWVLSLLGTIVLPVGFILEMGGSIWSQRKSWHYKTAHVILCVLYIAVLGIFDCCLIALCKKASGEWDSMSYTSISSIMCACGVAAPSLMRGMYYVQRQNCI